MVATLTSLELKSPLKLISFMSHVMKIVKQLKASDCISFKLTGFWTKHYTMTLWESAEASRNFARQGFHVESMKVSGKLSKEIRTLTIDSDTLPTWAEAKERLLKEGRILKF
jgi:hypothetical protein